MEKVRALSCRGSRAYIKAINELADRRGYTTADLVRKIMDEQLGSEIRDVVSFFESSGDDSNHKVTGEAVHAS